MRDHPHACGDKQQKAHCWQRAIGSSPRVWGQGKSFKNFIPRRRIIPTRVGTSAVRRSYFTSREDHPHACGDKRYSQGHIPPPPGSSPRVWGQESRGPRKLAEPRIIPTRVGTSVVNPICKHIFEDHPHACGDKFIDIAENSINYGSSPRVWGQDPR